MRSRVSVRIKSNSGKLSEDSGGKYDASCIQWG